MSGKAQVLDGNAVIKTVPEDLRADFGNNRKQNQSGSGKGDQCGQF